MKKIIPFLALLLFVASYKTQAQCTPVNCISNLPAYGGICDTNLLVGRVNVAYSDFESFVITSACFDAGLISPPNAGTSIRITNVDNFTYTGLPAGITAASNANAYTPPNPGNVAGCVRFQGTPTQIGVFRNNVNFLADVIVCTFPFPLADNVAGYGLRMTVLPDPAFTIPQNTYCVNDAAATLTVTGTTGGVFSGPGVSGSTFNPATAGIGTHSIKYKVSRQEGAAIAPAADSLIITVTVNGTTYYQDQDGDGFGSNLTTIACSLPQGYATVSGDCDDGNQNANPNATEVCDGIDNDCDGSIDEGLTQNTYYVDNDGDGFGSTTTFLSCLPNAPSGYSANNTDCNDNNAGVNPASPEVCDNADNNCNTQIDEGVPTNTYYRDVDGDTYGDPLVTTASCFNTAPTGYVANDDDCDDSNAGINPLALEIPGNSIDENCDGVDGAVDFDNDGFDNTVDCNDNNVNVYPGAPEICDGLDNNCAGGVDEGLPQNTYYEDADNDGFGSLVVLISTCSNTPPTGYVSNSTDCDDTNEFIHPNATEICDGIDNNCSGFIDEGLIFVTYYYDNDGDGYGVSTSFTTTCSGTPVDYALVDGDCNDNNPQINPGVTEIPNNDIDENCDGTLGTIDNDGDGFNSSVDCDDNNSAVNPDATEICDGIDNNCNTNIDENLATVVYYRDFDGDGFGDAFADSVTCATTAPAGYVSNNTDCNDADTGTNPDATEIPNNNIDEDCDGDDLTIGINTIAAEFGLTIYPNPAQTFIAVSGKVNSNLILTIYDLQGKAINSYGMVNGANQQFDISNLQSGYYLVEISNKATQQRGFTKIVVIK
jgi:Putative metal-binding motif/Secretion system C-terminal sorting domain